IRGIYHAVFTFYWALELYYHLDIAAEKKTLTFTKEERVKIKQRFLEEYFMLEFCRSDLQHAFKNKRVNKDGNQLINMIYDRISAYKKDTVTILENLKALDPKKFQEIIALKKELAETRTHYKLV
ncbi:MAG: hypothetical protein PHY93_08050, partial [Bacteriovorax sp.]|nr:hypothetical protein [Bacteriovorax sp.]